ncbi:MAG: recombinase family protein [Bacilli bacterium]|nr:recombinase family protein [Bacilli bacterium]
MDIIKDRARTVAIYARVSTEHEAQLSALENQVQYYDDLLEKHPSWNLYGRYIDEGITGTSIKKRKNFQRMIEDAKNGCFDLIITREVSRFARNTVDTLQETRSLKRFGVEVYFTDDNIWTLNDDDGELKLTIMATLAQNESKKTSQRVKAGQKISFQNGVIYGTGNILGYDKVGKKMVINEEQAKIVRLIYSLFLQGQGSSLIKYELEKRGYLTATGLKKWNTGCITRILQNSFYCGTLEYRKHYIPDYLEQKPKKNRGEVEKVIREGKHQPLISKEDFNKVQRIINSRSKKLTIKKNIGCGSPKSIWTKKLKCECGSSFNKAKYHQRNLGDISYCYQCYKQKNFGSVRSRLKRGLDVDGCCDIHLVQEWKLQIMSKVIFDLIWNEKEKIINMANQLIDETIKDNKNDIYEEELNYHIKRRKTIKDKIDKLLDMYLNELIAKDEYIRIKKEFEKSLSDIDTKINELELRGGVPINILEEKIKDIKNSISNILNHTNEKINDDLIDSLIDKIIVHKDHYDWKLNFIEGIKNINNQVSDDDETNVDKDVLLCRIMITNDDIEKYKNDIKDVNFVRSLKPMALDIYI